jgi:acetyltransferase-like isoleucine patch superfamily enzyme
MNLTTEEDFLGFNSSHPWSKHWTILCYKSGASSLIPHGFFQNWLDEDMQIYNHVNFHIGHCSTFNIGSSARYEGPHQRLRLGRFDSVGARVRFLLSATHEMGTISTFKFKVLLGERFQEHDSPQYADTVLKNDIWVGDEAMFLGGCVVEDGCVIGARSVVPPNFTSEPYGIYVGSPARLIRFRFSEDIRTALVKLAWWEMPMTWLQENNPSFIIKLDHLDHSEALDVLARLQESKDKFLARSKLEKAANPQV